MILLLISPLNIIGTLINFILPMNQDLYLDNIILAKDLACLRKNFLIKIFVLLEV